MENKEKEEIKRENGKRHRAGDKPAYIRYYENGQVKYEKWRENGKLHRVDKPAYIAYFESGQVRCEEWWENGEEKWRWVKGGKR